MLHSNKLYFYKFLFKHPSIECSERHITIIVAKMMNNDDDYAEDDDADVVRINDHQMDADIVMEPRCIPSTRVRSIRFTPEGYTHTSSMQVDRLSMQSS